jgi:DNA-binding XRE family transcriptional regulator
VYCQLKSILALLDVNQDKLAENLGVHRNTITNISNNKTIPSLKLAYDIIDNLNHIADIKEISLRWTVEDVWKRN